MSYIWKIIDRMNATKIDVWRNENIFILIKTLTIKSLKNEILFIEHID